MKASKILFMGLFAAVLVGSQAAKADGFVCADESNTYGLKIYDNVTASFGTRNPAVMVISNGSQESGAKTLATFTPAQGGLQLSGGVYVVNLNFPPAYTQTFGGVKMSDIKELNVLINHNFNQVLAPGQKVPGSVSIVEKSGKFAVLKLVCKRYLKN